MFAVDSGQIPYELQRVTDPSPDDMRLGALKYNRNPGHRLSTKEDRDPIAAG
jgi:hypothetical protein